MGNSYRSKIDGFERSQLHNEANGLERNQSNEYTMSCNQAIHVKTPFKQYTDRSYLANTWS